MSEPASLALSRAAAAFYLQKQLDRQFKRVGAKAPPVRVRYRKADNPKTWMGRKFAIDIDGFSNTWSNFLVRMLYGCCVLKVQSQFGFRQWYYDKLVPYEHYVPVAADMSDFAEKIEWVRTNDAEARAIARRGQAFAQTLTFETQTRRAVELIEERWDRGVSSYSAN